LSNKGGQENAHSPAWDTSAPSELFWLNLQGRYDLETEKDRLGAALDDIRPLAAAS
jgi:plasmid maintenance system antidote protein VapI